MRIVGRAMKEFYHRGSAEMRVCIRHNGQQVWPASGWARVRPYDLTGCTHDITLSLRQGDTIRFVLDRGEDPENRILCWMPRIAYLNRQTAHRTESPAVRILCGAPEPYVDSIGNTWSADRYFEGGRPFRTHDPVEGASPSAADSGALPAWPGRK